MKKNWVLIPLLAIACVSCGKLKQTMQAIEDNNNAIGWSTYAISQNVQAVQEANAAIAENRRQIEAVNQSLKEVGEKE